MENAKKPKDAEAILSFAKSAAKSEPTPDTPKPKKVAQKRTQAAERKINSVPEGDSRFTVNITKDAHRKMKMRAAAEDTTAGKIVQEWIDSWK